MQITKKEKILETAIELFVTQGFENTPTSQISKEAGVATGTLFHHFKTKEDLINSAYIKSKEEFFNSLEDENVSSENLKSKKDVKVKFKKVWTLFTKWTYKNKLKMQFMKRFHNSIYISKLSHKKYEELSKPINELITKALELKVFKKMPKDLFEGYFSACFYSQLDYLWKKKIYDNKIILQSFELFWDGLKRD